MSTSNRPAASESESEVQATAFVQRKSYSEGWTAGYSMKREKNPYHSTKEALNHFTWESGQADGYMDAASERD